ncbi:SphA family protein [Methylobacterium oxalidis]|uniref:SphA family protein n=1 Tax=Methylobacterium oxalidis TaxID=944322 RepID=UPI003314D9FB
MVRLGVAAASILAVAGHTTEASAAESIFPFLPGVTVGVPIGALPPPGLYFAGYTNVWNLEIKDRTGRGTGIKVGDFNVGAQALWVPGVTVLGASYGAFVVQPFRRATVDARGFSAATFEPINTVISPINLSWNLQNGFFISAGLTIYLKNPVYDPLSPLNVGRNYFSFEPSLGLSYFNNGWNLSLHPVVEFNTENRANRYRSGTIFLMDYTATKQVGQWEFGAGGTVVEQLADDKIGGVVVAAGPAGRGRGNRARSLTVGPVVGYDFGPINVKFYFLKDVYAENTAGGERFWFRINVPLATAAPNPSAKAAGVRS